MNLTDLRQTDMLTAFTAVREAAAAHGVAVLESELVGLAPAAAVLPAAARTLALPGLAPRQVLELAWAWPEGALADQTDGCARPEGV